MRNLVLVLFVFLAPIVAQASTVASILPSAEQRGEATFKFLGLSQYKARLFTLGGGAFNWQQDFALELIYKRNFTAYDLVEATMREMKRVGAPPPIRDELSNCFDDVAPGDSYLAVTDGSNRIGFWRNGRPACTLSHPQIKHYFMSIFLGDTSRSKKFTRRLRGL